MFIYKEYVLRFYIFKHLHYFKSLDDFLAMIRKSEQNNIQASLIAVRDGYGEGNTLTGTIYSTKNKHQKIETNNSCE